MFLKPTTTPLRLEPSCFRLKFQERARLRQLPVTSSTAGVGVAMGVGVANGVGVAMGGDGDGGQSAAVERSPQPPPLPHAPRTSAKVTAVASANTLRIALIICIL